jgi:hypothetical protein
MPVKLKREYDKLEDVPEAYREQFEEDATTKKFVLKEIEIPDMPDVAGLKASQEKILGEKKKLQDQLDALKDVNAEEYRKLKAESTQRETDQLKSEGKFDELFKKWQEQKTADEKLFTDQIAALNAKIDGYEIDGQLREAMIKGGVSKLAVPDLVELHRKRVQKTEKGTLLMLDAPGGEPLDVSLEGFYSTVYKDQMPLYYEATGAGGSGASAANNGGARGARTIPASDQSALNSNIADIAAGKVVVNPT